MKHQADETGKKYTSMSVSVRDASGKIRAITRDSNTAAAAQNKWATALKVGIPVAALATAGLLQLSGIVDVLGAGIGLLSSALVALLTPFTALAAVAVAAAGPLLVLSGILAGVAAAAGLGLQTALKNNWSGFDKLHDVVAKLASGFHAFSFQLARDFLPFFLRLAPIAENVLHTFLHLAEVAGRGGFTGFLKAVGPAMRQLNADLVKVAAPLGDVIQKTIAYAFGKGGREGQGILVSDFSRFTGWADKAFQPIIKWFDRQHFIATGARWAAEIVHGALPIMVHGLVTGFWALFHQNAVGTIAAIGVAVALLAARLAPLATLIGGLGGGGAAGGAAGAAGGAAGGGGLLAALGIGAGTAAAITAVVVGLGGVAYWLTTIRGHASATQKAFDAIQKAIHNLAPTSKDLARNTENSANALKHLNAVVAKSPDNLRAIGKAQDAYEHSLEKGVGISQHYAHQLDVMKNGTDRLLRSTQSVLAPTGKFGGAAKINAGILADLEGKLTRNALAEEQLAQKTQRSNPILADNARKAAAVAIAAEEVARKINAIPTYKQIQIQMNIDELINQYVGPTGGRPAGGSPGNPHGTGRMATGNITSLNSNTASGSGTPIQVNANLYVDGRQVLAALRPAVIRQGVSTGQPVFRGRA